MVNLTNFKVESNKIKVIEWCANKYNYIAKRTMFYKNISFNYESYNSEDSEKLSFVID